MENSEIIEFPWVVLDTITLEIVYEQRIYVKPDFLDGITNYCTRLTGISKSDCENGIPLRDAIHQFDAFVTQFLYQYGMNNFRIVTDSVWDLQVQLRQEAARKKIQLGKFFYYFSFSFSFFVIICSLFLILEWWYSNYFDLREEFRHFYAWVPFLKREPPLYIMLNGIFLILGLFFI